MSRRPRAVGNAARALGAAVVLGALALWWFWPRLFPGPLEQARSAYARRDWSAAADSARQALRVRPDDRDALRLLARSSGRMGRDASADALYRRLGPGAMAAEDYLVIAACLQRQGDLRSALRLLEKGHEADPDHADTLHDLSRFCASMDQMARATALAERLASRPDEGARAALLLGAIRDRQSDPAGAAEAFAKALRLDPQLRGLSPTPAEATKLLARDLLRLGKPAEAREALGRVADAGRDREASWLLGRAWLQEGQVDRARAALNRAGEFAADDPLGFEPAPHVGSARCAECHGPIYRAQQSSRHARTFAAAADLGRVHLPDRPVPDPSDPATAEHRARHDGAVIRWETRADGELARAIVGFAFGSGDRGLTLVGRDDAGLDREIRLSRYADIDGWDVTAGQPARPEPWNAGVLLGRGLGADGLRQCLSCHTTDARAARERAEPLLRDRGIGCERCHGPAGNHLKAIASGFPEPAVARPQLATAARVTALCAECHSPRARSLQPTDADAVRFQGTTLLWSRCYQESGGALSCVTCHDPHRDARTSATFYEAKCLGCHSAPAAAALRAGQGTVCKVNPSTGCLDCHMPATKSAVPHTTFTDHDIRVHAQAGPAR